MISFKDYLQEKKKDPCWTGYEAIGMKEKNGKKVPNCVPQNEEVEYQFNIIEEAEDHLSKANDAEREGRMKDFHMHMMHHHDAMSSWHADNDRHAMADKHDRKSEYHEQKAREIKEEVELEEAATADAKGHKSATGGLTQKGRDAYNREHGSHLKAPVTTPPSKLKAGSKAANRRKSFCARMSGVDGPMKKPNGEPTRKALALRKWNC